jgi:DNA-binding GntR family transcriptional regulator
VPTDPDQRASESLYLAETARQSHKLSRKMVFVGLEPASAAVASRLRIEPCDPVFARRKLMFCEGVPVRIATSYFLPQLVQYTKLTEPDFISGGLQVVLEDLGYRFGRAEETFWARMPLSQELAMLELEADTPVVVILRSSYDALDRPVHTLESLCAANRTVFTTNQFDHDTTF